MWAAASRPDDAFRLGGSTIWYLVNPYCYWMVFVPLIFVMFYMMLWATIRGALFSRMLGRVFTDFDVIPVIHHRDGCNGFAPVGTMAVRNGFLAVLLGFWAIFLIVFPKFLEGEQVNFGLDAQALLLVYLIGAPALVLSGLWSAHRALVRAKNAYLDGVGEQIRHLLAETDARAIRRSAGLLEELQYNRKRIRRVMDIWGWTLPRSGRQRTGRAHTGRIRREGSNERWCSDTLELACWNGEMVMIGFALDCCDREALAHIAAPRHLTRHDIQALLQRAVATRFGGTRPPHPIQWLSDNDGIFTALDTICTAERLHLIPITTPAYSPQSNGMAEAFVNTLRRDDINSADLASAQVVLAQIPGWFADYNTTAPHSALGFKSPIGFRTDRDQDDRAKSVS